MTGILTQLKTVVHDLQELQASFALVGAFAVSIHTEPRTTRDIDVVLLADSTEKQEDFIAQLLQRGYSQKQLLFAGIPTKRIGTRVQIPAAGGSAVALDLLFSCTGIEAEIVAGAITIEVFPGLGIPVANRAHVLAMKVLSQNDNDRIRDKADVQRLMSDMSASELRIASDALALIKGHGFGRGKDLMAELKRDLQNYAPHLLVEWEKGA